VTGAEMMDNIRRLLTSGEGGGPDPIAMALFVIQHSVDVVQLVLANELLRMDARARGLAPVAPTAGHAA
jgi:hypothetical protein